MRSALETGFELDRLWHRLRGEMEATKKPALLAVARILDEAGVAYALIGGLALQIHQREPRTTLDIDLAVVDRAAVPRPALEAGGFRHTGRFPHSDNWLAPDGTPLQITDDAALAGAIARAGVVDLDGQRLRVIGVADLIHEKLRAGTDPARRRSKRIQDLADVAGLLEQDPALAVELSAAERAILETLPR